MRGSRSSTASEPVVEVTLVRLLVSAALAASCLSIGCAKPEAAPTSPAPPSPSEGVVTPPGPAGLLEHSPADNWQGADLKVTVTDVNIRGTRASPTAIAIDVFVADGADQPIETLAPEDLALTVDGKYVPGTWQVQSFREAGRGLALGLLIPTHAAFATPVDLGEGRTWSPSDALVAGARDLIAGLAPNDQVALFGLTEEGFKRVSPWGAPSAAAAALKDLPVPPAEPRYPPRTFKAFTKVLEDLAENEVNLPARRVLLVVSDGLDPDADRPDRIGREIAMAVDKATELHVSPWVFAFTLGPTEPLANLEALASKAKGRYVVAAAEPNETLGARFARFGGAAAKGFVVTFTRAPGVILPTDVAETRVTLRAGAGVARVSLGGVLKVR